MLTVLMQAQKITAVVMGENHKTVITFDLQLYEKAMKLQMHKAPDLDHLVFRIGEMHTIMASLRALGASIDGSGFDEGWIEAGLCASTTTRQLLEGNHMKRALTDHSITYSALSDLHVEAFLKSESAKSNAEHKTVYDSVIQASVAMNTIPFCAIGPDHAMEHVNKLMKIRGGLKGLTQQPAAMARWFLVAPGLSGLATRAEHMVWVQRASSSHHHDLSDAITNSFNENVQKLKDVLKVSDPFATEERHLVNIITKAVMPDYIKEGVLTRDKIGQALSDTFAQERIVEAKLSVWSPMKKANLKSWKSAWQTNFKKNKTTCGVAPLKG